jgi:hypothetical protein
MVPLPNLRLPPPLREPPPQQVLIGRPGSHQNIPPENHFSRTQGAALWLLIKIVQEEQTHIDWNLKVIAGCSLWL